MATMAECGAESVRLAKSRKGKNHYTQEGNRNYVWGKPEGSNPGYSDCSSFVRACILRATGLDIGGNTSAQIDNRTKKGRVLEWGIKEGRKYPTQSALTVPGLVAIYYKGNSAHSLGVGHVELYTGGTQLYGHGSGVGPVEHNLKTYSLNRGAGREYLCAIEWWQGGAETKTYKLGDRPLMQGCKGDDVAELQAVLVSLGYTAVGTIDGDYGPKAEMAVRCYQFAWGLVETGIADLATITAIRNTMTTGDPGSTTQQILVTGGAVNIRSGAGMEYPVIGDVKSGDRLDATGRALLGWYEVKYKSKIGWISSKLSEVAP